MLLTIGGERDRAHRDVGPVLGHRRELTCHVVGPDELGVPAQSLCDLVPQLDGETGQLAIGGLHDERFEWMDGDGHRFRARVGVGLSGGRRGQQQRSDQDSQRQDVSVDAHEVHSSFFG